MNNGDQHHYEVVLRSAEEGGYTAFVPALKGCWSEGETEEEALDNIRDAIREYLSAIHDSYPRELLRSVTL
jgi:predicted RNase H-like HicB family nuclease